MSEKKGQGAFEYLMSYGWAILIVIVLGIVLWNLGVFNPNTTPEASGFTILRPGTWEFTGAASQTGWAEAEGDTSVTYVAIAFQNVAGIDLILRVNETNSSIQFKKPGSGICQFHTNPGSDIFVNATDEQGNRLVITDNSVAVPAGSTVILRGWLKSDQGGCGGLSKGPYRYSVITVSTDAFNISHTDTGFITGRYT
ncbi:MAG: hypothetical protein QXP42_00990 [Candidatus Micrarchaeia archaeon]